MRKSTLYRGDTELLRWEKDDGALQPSEIILRMAEACRELPVCRAPCPSPASPTREQLAFYPVSDLHMGMYVWGRETGKNWDLKIAEEELNAAYDRLLSKPPPARYAVILGGGDAFHAENNDNETLRGKNKLQVDGRYGKVFDATVRFFVRRIDAALLKHGRVDVRILPGNHDEHSSTALAYFLAAWYRHEPRVAISTDPSAFWFYRYGSTFLAATHGHKAKAGQLPAIMAARRPRVWGESIYRYGHSFHLHRGERLRAEAGGAVVEVHPVAIPNDAWSYGQGFISRRRISSIIYDPVHGEDSRFTINM